LDWWSTNLSTVLGVDARMQRNSNRRVTMKAVAKRAGVSQTTVSYVINGVTNASISEETRQRVYGAIEDLGYHPNAAARKMRTNRSHLIGFITDEIATTPFAGNIFKGAQDAAWANNKLILLSNTDNNDDLEQTAVKAMLEHQVEGIIYAAMYHRLIVPPRALYEAPSVLLNCFCADRSLPSVVSDEVSGGRMATEVLLRKGHRRIAFANHNTADPGVVGRLEGYKQALAAYGIPFDEDMVCVEIGQADGGYRCAMRLFQQADRPTALFCYNDRMAMGAYDALRKLKLSIPDDVAVVGFDNQEIIAAHLHPGLTTLELPHYELGKWAVEYLLAHIDEAYPLPPVQHVIRCPLVERASA
jgi:LacI family transcriptional regulator